MFSIVENVRTSSDIVVYFYIIPRGLRLPYRIKQQNISRLVSIAVGKSSSSNSDLKYLKEKKEKRKEEKGFTPPTACFLQCRYKSYSPVMHSTRQPTTALGFT